MMILIKNLILFQKEKKRKVKEKHLMKINLRKNTKK